MSIELLAIVISTIIIIMAIRRNRSKLIRYNRSKNITKVEYAPCGVLYICDNCNTASKEEELISETLNVTDQEGDRIYGTTSAKRCKCGGYWFQRVLVMEKSYGKWSDLNGSR